MKCNACKKEYSADCDHNRGRCPHRKPMIEIQPKDTSKGHFYVSLAKSFIRITAGVCLMLVDVEPATTISFIKTAGALLIAAEVLGIVEELV